MNNIYAIDCEMVGCGYEGVDSVLARCSIVDFNGKVVLDEYVLPQPSEIIYSYRTEHSGITKDLLDLHGKSFTIVRNRVKSILKDKVIIGHSPMNDFKALWIFPDDLNITIKDTAMLYMQKNRWTKRPGLKTLVKKEFGVSIQDDVHDSIIDAQYTMRLYKNLL